MKKKTLIITMTATSLVAIAATALLAKSGSIFNALAEGKKVGAPVAGNYTLNLDSGNSINVDPEDAEKYCVYTTNHNKVGVAYTGTYQTSIDYWIKIDKAFELHNTTPITGLKSVTVYADSIVTVSYGYLDVNDDIVYVANEDLASSLSGTKLNIPNTPSYLKFSTANAENEEVTITGVLIEYSCSASSYYQPVAVENLTVMTYGQFVSQDRHDELEAGITSFLESKNVTVSNLVFEYESTTSSISTFMDKVSDYDTAHPDATVDVLFGLKTNSAITGAGFESDGVSYGYGDKSSAANNADRRLWFKTNDAIPAVKRYLRNNWKTFTIGLYDKFIKDEEPDNKLTALKDGLTAAFGSQQIVFAELGTGGVSSAVGKVPEETEVLLGFYNDNGDALANAKYVRYSAHSYTYGTDGNRKLWVYESKKDSAGVTTVYDYLEAKWR